MNKAKFLSFIKSPVTRWSVFDFANTAWSTVIITFIFSTYFTKKIAVSPESGTILWGHLMTVVGLVVAITCPILGSIADLHAGEKGWLIVFAIGNACCAWLLWFAYPDHNSLIFTMLICGFGTLFYEYVTLFYNALLPRIVPTKKIGRISGIGWGIGYLGGLCCLTFILLTFINPETPPFGLDTKTSMQIRIIGPIVGTWFLFFALPLISCKLPKQDSDNLGYVKSVRMGLAKLISTLKTVHKNKPLFYFLLARMFFADGLNTLFSFAGIYAAGTFGFSIQDVIVFGICCNIISGIGSIILSWLDDLVGPKTLMLMNLFCMTCFTTMIIFATTKVLFLVFSLSSTFFIGSIQGASRSYLARIAPPDKRSEMFGLFSLSGKATAFLGPFLLAQLTLWFHSQRAGMSSVIIFFILGIIMLFKLPDIKQVQSETTS